jgi:hypothetical protein
MMPKVMTSHPTVDWERRADSFWAVTREEMQDSDIRSKIMDRDEDDVVDGLLWQSLCVVDGMGV